jgi:putative acetyltransferase
MREWVFFCQNTRNVIQLNSPRKDFKFMKIRTYQETDHSQIADLFHRTVHAIDVSFYSQAELEAWAPTPPNHEYWKTRLAMKKPFVAIADGLVIGFIELENDGHIDCLYVDEEHQQKGIASRLLKHVKTEAKDRSIDSLYAEASKVALPFFKKHGFTIDCENQISLRGQTLTNYSMTLCLRP